MDLSVKVLLETPSLNLLADRRQNDWLFTKLADFDPRITKNVVRT